MTSIGIPKITTEGLGIPSGIPDDVDCVGRPWTLIDPKALILLDFRHKKRRPGTSLDVEVVEPGGFKLCT
ncbi:hypothetical protein [Pseudomonas synxantha]|uniref:hypothetical protein n=1 Tax=Pseudomonas synxantha TaxID=47883 RepID=UPI000F5806E6|nr:hypothetical protein [Pseudomonas synxantha]